MTQQMAYPGVYPDADSIIPYSKNKRFGFTGKVIDVESMKNMSIEQIVELYKLGYRIENMSSINNHSNDLSQRYKEAHSLSPTIVAADGISIGTGAIVVVGIGLLLWFLVIKR